MKKRSASYRRGKRRATKAKSTVRESLTDWPRLEGTKDSEIDFSDAPRLDSSFFKKAELRMPRKKQAVSLRLDPDILEWFKSQGEGYQTRINAVLRLWVEAHHH